MLRYLQDRYHAENVTLIVAGRVNPEAVLRSAEALCGAWTGSPRVPLRDHPNKALRPCWTGRYKQPLERFRQQSVVMAYPSVPPGHQDEPVVEVLTALLGGPNSRCYWNMVQKGICNEAGAVALTYDGVGTIALYADGDPEEVDEFHSALVREAAGVMEIPFREDEVRRVRNRRRTMLAVESESPRSRLMQLIDDIETFDRPRSASERLDEIERVTPARIDEYLRRFPTRGDGYLLSVGQRDWPVDAARC
jgi:predicted Zn-dependent peptidase